MFAKNGASERDVACVSIYTEKRMNHALLDGMDCGSPGFGRCSGFSAECVKVQCHISFQTQQKCQNASPETSTLGAKTQGEEHRVLAATHPH